MVRLIGPLPLKGRRLTAFQRLPRLAYRLFVLLALVFWAEQAEPSARMLGDVELTAILGCSRAEFGVAVAALVSTSLAEWRSEPKRSPWPEQIAPRKEGRRARASR